MNLNMQITIQDGTPKEIAEKAFAFVGFVLVAVGEEASELDWALDVHAPDDEQEVGSLYSADSAGYTQILKLVGNVVLPSEWLNY